MIKKYLVLICLFITVVLMLIAVSKYPGGSMIDENSEGFDWTKNFFSNLFQEEAVNGTKNPSRVWAIIGMAFYSIAYGIFFINMSTKMTSSHFATVLKIIGVVNILFNFLIVTPFHDKMIIISSTLFLVGLFYITVSILKTKHHILKFASILCLLIFYFTLYLYGSGNWGLLALMQKITMISSMALVLGLEYFTIREDFNIIATDLQKSV